MTLLEGTSNMDSWMIFLISFLSAMLVTAVVIRILR